MILGLALLGGYGFLVWLVFFKLHWLRFTIGWGVFSSLFVVHLMLIFVIGLRFVTPMSTNAKVIRYTIQLVPRLSEPTLVTAVLVAPNAHVKKGQPLFQFDRRPYEYKVRQLEAELAAADQNVRVLDADVNVAKQLVAKAQSALAFATYQEQQAKRLASSHAGPTEEVHKWRAQRKEAEAAVSEARAEVERTRLKYTSQIGGVNTTVAQTRAELDEARYYLDNTTLVAPEDGYIMNLQVRPGMVAGDIRVGAIASLVCDANSYVLATFTQENLKYVEIGQPVEIAFNLYPGQIFTGRVNHIWHGTGEGQLLPTGTLPKFLPPPPDVPQGLFAVMVDIDEPVGSDTSTFPIGAQGTLAIYTKWGVWSVLRKIEIRARTWLNFLYPL